MSAYTLTYLQSIIDAHPTRVHQLLLSKGINAKPTPEVLANAYVLFKKPFIAELVNIVSPRVSNFSEDIKQIFLNAIDSAKSTNETWSKIEEELNNAAKIISQVSDIVNNTGNIDLNAKAEAEKQESDKQAKTMFWIAISIIVVILIAILIAKKS